MRTTNISIKYRPMRVGFIVRPDSLDDVIKAANINTLLWGGIFNPIIPLEHDKHNLDYLIKLFAVDELYLVSAELKGHPALKDYKYLYDGIKFTDLIGKVWNTEKLIVNQLDAI